MNCPRCQKPVAPGAAFCASCGLPLTGPNAVGVANAFADDAKRKRTVIAVVSAIALLCAIFGGLAMSGVLGLGGKSSPSSLQATGVKPKATMAVQGTPAPSVTEVTATAPPEMPKEIRDWLEHLRRCEELKRELTLDMGSEMKSLVTQLGVGITSVEGVKEMTDPDSDISHGPHANVVGDMTRRMKLRWTDLSDQFRKYAPPPECKGIADSFDAGINGLASDIDTLGDLVSSWNALDDNATQDLNRRKDAAARMNRTHTTNVDDNFKAAQKGL